jgi:hypothetical protein
VWRPRIDIVLSRYLQSEHRGEPTQKASNEDVQSWQVESLKGGTNPVRNHSPFHIFIIF